MPWKMAEHVRNIPIINQTISDIDAKNLLFPIMAENIMEIYLENDIDNTVIPYTDNRLLKAIDARAKKGDSIIISFIPKTCSNILLKLVMKDIYSYSGNENYDSKNFRHSLGSAQISITTGGETPSCIPPAKYHITQPWIEFISVYANTVYISEVKYIS